MKPISDCPLFPLAMTVKELRHQLSCRFTSFVLLYFPVPRNIVSIVKVSDTFALALDDKIQSVEKSPWFVTQTTSILQILDQFRSNNQTVAVILDTTGVAVGILTLDQIIDAIFGPEGAEAKGEERMHLIDRTLRGSMTVYDFNMQFFANLPGENTTTLSDLILSKFDHPVSIGETVEIWGFEFTVIDQGLTGIKTVGVRTLK